MNVAGKVVVVTGGGNGIGRALARRFADEGAKGVVVADIEGATAASVAEQIGGLAVRTDVADEDAVRKLVDRTEAEIGPIDLFCSNAGIARPSGLEMDNEDWARIWDVNVMSHVYAARAVLPSMIERGHGYLLQTVSAAGLLTNIGAAAYTTTKHAALGLAEWLAVTYGDRGIKVSALCPQFVKTALIEDLKASEEMESFMDQSAIDVEAVADAVVQGLADERFLILPHPEVAQYVLNKAGDYDRWLGGMRRIQRDVIG